MKSELLNFTSSAISHWYDPLYTLSDAKTFFVTTLEHRVHGKSAAAQTRHMFLSLSHPLFVPYAFVLFFIPSLLLAKDRAGNGLPLIAPRRLMLVPVSTPLRI